jgi:transposase-like protein
MEQTASAPETLLQAVRFFSDPDVCLSFLASIRWPDGRVACPTCGSQSVTFLRNQRRWKCYERHPRAQFSIKVGTIFEDSPIPLEKWLPAVWMLVNDKNGISSYEVSRALAVTQKTAWFMMHRIRLALEDGSLVKLRGRVEADETFIGGRVKNMHITKRRRVQASRRGGAYSKAIVMGLLERNTKKVRMAIIETTDSLSLQRVIRQNVETGSEVMTDAWRGYRGLSADFIHQYVDHMKEYVRGHIHTNGLENFWTLLKRAIKGTYVAVEPYHLHRYVEEQAFRFNERVGKDADRFLIALHGIVGRRITYKALTGAVATT